MNLSPRERQLLRDVLHRTKESSMQHISAREYRVNYLTELATLDGLESKRLLRRDEEKNTLRVTLYGLLFIRDRNSEDLLSDIERIVSYSREQYKANLGARVPISVMSDALELPIKRVAECIYYMRDAPCTAFSEGSLYLEQENAYECPAEWLFTYERYRDIAEQRFNEIRPTSEKKKKETSKVHGNAERFSSTREKVMGAAAAFLAKYPDKFRRNNGTLNNSALAKAIEQKSPLWFDDQEPPSTRQMAELIRDYVKTLD